MDAEVVILHGWTNEVLAIKDNKLISYYHFKSIDLWQEIEHYTFCQASCRLALEQLWFKQNSRYKTLIIN